MTRQADGSLVVVGSSRQPSPDNRIYSPSLAIARFRSVATGFAGLIGLTSTTCRCPDDGGPAEFVVRRTGGSTGAVAVDFETVDGSAVAGSDYVAKRGRLEWPDGDQSTRKIVLALIDNSKTAPEDFTLRLSDPTGGAILTTSIATVSITDNSAPSEVQLLASEATIGEAGGSIVLTVVRNGAAGGAANVQYTTSSGTATAGTDFTSASGTLSWADGDSASKSITVNVRNDTTDESNETFTVRLSNPSAGTVLGSNSTATVTITDDDDASIIRFFSTAVGVAEAWGSLELPVTRTGSSVGAVSVDYATVSGTATAGADFASASGTLHWADGDSASKTITVNITNDTTDESNETFTVRLSNPSADSVPGSISTATVTITDDDEPAPSGDGDGGSGALDWLVLFVLTSFYLYRQQSRMGRDCESHVCRSPAACAHRPPARGPVHRISS